MTTSPGGKYEAELDTLRDHLIEAVRSRRLAALEAGLEVFEELGKAVLQRVRRIDAAMEGRRKAVSWRQALGGSRPVDRLAPLSQALWPVIEEGVVRGDPQLVSRMLNTVNDLALTAHTSGDLASFSDVVDLYHRAASRLTASSHGAAAGLVGVSDLTRQLLAIVQVLHMRARTGSDIGDTPSYMAGTLRQSWNMARLLIDEADSSELERWTRAYEGSLELPMHGDGESSSALADLRQVGAIALRGWILMSWHEPWRPMGEAEAVALYAALDGADVPSHLWKAVVGVTDEELGDTLGFNWWEASARPELRGYVVRFPTYREDAAALALLEHPAARASIPRTADLADMDLRKLRKHGWAAERLQSAVQRLEAYDALDVGAAAVREQVVALLDVVVEELKTREATQLVQRPLEPERVVAFQDAVLAGTADRTSFAAMLASCMPDDASRTDETPTLFGVHTLAPKDYFVESQVHADPSSLGENLASAVVRGEDDLALKAIFEGCDSESLGESEPKDIVARTIKRFDQHRDLHVVFIGVPRWWVQIRGAMQQDMGSGFHDPFRVDGVTYSQHHSNEFRGVLVAQLSRLACYSRVIAHDDDQSAGEVAVLSVDPVTPVDAEEMALAADPHLAGEPLQTEMFRLQQRVRVRVFVRPWLRILDPQAGMVITPNATSPEDGATEG